MAFPADPVDLLVELDLVGDWSSPTDVTSYVRGREQVEIRRGRSSEGRVADPSQMTLTLDNRTGRFSPRNPLGAYYGTLGRNTPIRASVLAGSVRAVSYTPGAGYFSAPDSAATSITGDIDIRVDTMPLDGWRSGTLARSLANKYGAVGQRSWYLQLNGGGTLTFYWSADGTNLLSAESTVPVPYPVVGRRAVRVTLDVNNGAGGKTVTFYTADTISGTWTQLGDAVTTSGTTSIFNSTAGTNVSTHTAETYAAEVRNGIGGSAVASPTFTSQAEGTSSFADAQGNTWTASASYVRVTARRFRFYGEVSSWPQSWDPTGTDVYAQVTAAGVLRRLGQGATPLQSSLRRGILGVADSVVAYWPAEEGEGAEQIGSAVGGAAMTITGTPDLAAFDDFAASEAIPLLAGSRWAGDIPTSAPSGTVQTRFLMAVPSGGTVNAATLMRVWCTGTAARWDLNYTTGGGLELRAFDATATEVLNSGAVAFAVNGKLLLVSVEIVQNGSDIDWRFATMQQGGTSGSYTSGTLASRTVGRPYRVHANPQGSHTDTAMGHIYVQSEQTSLFELLDQLNAFSGETAGERLERLAGEEGVSMVVIGDPADTSPMGAQQPATLLDLLRECADADGGMLGEPRTDYGLAYVTRTALSMQDPALSLNYSAGHLSELEPVDDDQQVRNDVTVTRRGGSSYRATLDSGALSTAAPPAGVGRYAESVTLNLETDDLLADLAGWRLHLGTVDEPRYPSIDVRLERAPFVASAALRTQVLDADVGSLVEVTDLPSWLPPGDARQLVRGYTETLANFEHRVTFAGDPGSPWDTSIYDDPEEEARYHSDGSTLAASATSSATSLSVSTPDGPLWTTDAAEMPFDIEVSGERMTVTAISGTTSPQTFTVTRAVNGITKAQSAGATVDLAPPTVYAI